MRPVYICCIFHGSFFFVVSCSRPVGHEVPQERANASALTIYAPKCIRHINQSTQNLVCMLFGRVVLVLFVNRPAGCSWAQTGWCFFSVIYYTQCFAYMLLRVFSGSRLLALKYSRGRAFCRKCRHINTEPATQRALFLSRAP